jgi:transposase
LFLRHAVAGHRTALRHPLRHALRTVRPLDPARPVAWAAQPAARLRGCSGTERRSHRQSVRSAPSCFDRGMDGGKKIRGVKINVAVDKYGIPLAIDVSPANRHDTKAIVPVLRTLAEGGFEGAAFGDLGYRGERLANVGETLGITVEAIARGRDGRFVPTGICWVVERSFAWLSRYRRLNAIFERSKEHLIAFVSIEFISILSRRMRRLVAEELST